MSDMTRKIEQYEKEMGEGKDIDEEDITIEKTKMLTFSMKMHQKEDMVDEESEEDDDDDDCVNAEQSSSQSEEPAPPNMHRNQSHLTSLNTLNVVHSSPYARNRHRTKNMTTISCEKSTENLHRSIGEDEFLEIVDRAK